MAHHVVDGRANAFGIALKVEVCRDSAVLNGVVVNPAVNLLGGDSCVDVFGNIVEYANIYCGRALNALDVLRSFEQVAGEWLGALVVETLQFLVKCLMALLVFLAAAAPAGIVASWYWSIVIHG